MQLLFHSHIIRNFLKLIFFVPDILIADYAISEKYNCSLVMLTFSFLGAMSKFLTRLIGDEKKAVLYTSIFFPFIKITIFLLLFFKARIILNYNGLVYLNVV